MVDTLIRLFRSTDIDFSTNGIGVLIDTTKCVVKEERNGIFELELTYPINGRYYDQLTLRRIIVAKSSPYSNYQAFRIFEISKVINGTITVNAQHISYDLIGYPVSPFEADGISELFQNIKDKSIIEHPFTFETNKESDASFSIVTPRSTKSLLGGEEGSILDIYGGEYEFDNFNVILHAERGGDRGVVIRYGKNLTSLDQDENCSDVYTGVYPYWYSDEEGLLELSGDQKYIETEGTYDFVRLYPLDLSSDFTEKPSEDDLKEAAENYILSNNIGIPKVSLTISFVELSRSGEYKHIAALEQVRLCDTVNVEFPEMNVSAKSKCISTTYNVITDRYESIDLGEEKSNIATTIAENDLSISSVKSGLTNTTNNLAYNVGDISSLASRVKALEDAVFSGE